MLFLTRAAFLGGLMLVPGTALANDYKVGSLHIDRPWARATPPGAQVGGGYVTITNGGTEPDRLTGASSPVAGEVTIHQMEMVGGVMHMQSESGGLEIKPGETLTLKPGGYHLMFEHLKEPLKRGERVPATLDFARAGKVNVEFSVESVGARGPAEHDMSHGESGRR